MKRTLIATLILIVTAAAVAAPPGRGPAPGGGPGRPGGPMPGALPPQALAEFLDLSDAQIEQARTLRETMQATVEPIHEQLRANHEQIEAALASGNSARAGELAVASYNLRQQIKAAHDAFKTSFTAMLNAEQKEKFAVYEELMQLRGKRPGRTE